MRLTLELVANAEQLVGPCNERILCLRGYRIPAIENLGATKDLFNVIDLCENDLMRLDNFPPMSKLLTLMLANNRISKCGAEIFESLPNLISLLLTNNRIASLSDLLPIFKAKSLERLSLLNNPVTLRDGYRPFVIYNLPSLRFLDFQHVKLSERQSAKTLFSGEEGQLLLNKLSNDSSGLVPTTLPNSNQADVEMKDEGPEKSTS